MESRRIERCDQLGDLCYRRLDAADLVGTKRRKSVLDEVAEVWIADDRRSIERRRALAETNATKVLQVIRSNKIEDDTAIVGLTSIHAAIDVFVHSNNAEPKIVVGNKIQASHLQGLVRASIEGSAPDSQDRSKADVTRVHAAVEIREQRHHPPLPLTNRVVQLTESCEIAGQFDTKLAERRQLEPALAPFIVPIVDRESGEDSQDDENELDDRMLPTDGAQEHSDATRPICSGAGILVFSGGQQRAILASALRPAFRRTNTRGGEVSFAALNYPITQLSNYPIQKSTCTLNRMNRGSSTAVGCNHRAPFVAGS